MNYKLVRKTKRILNTTRNFYVIFYNKKKNNKYRKKHETQKLKKSYTKYIQKINIIIYSYIQFNRCMMHAL